MPNKGIIYVSCVYIQIWTPRTCYLVQAKLTSSTKCWKSFRPNWASSVLISFSIFSPSFLNLFSSRCLLFNFTIYKRGIFQLSDGYLLSESFCASEASLAPSKFPRNQQKWKSFKNSPFEVSVNNIFSNLVRMSGHYKNKFLQENFVHQWKFSKFSQSCLQKT